MTKIHPLSDVQTVKIGSNTSIWQFCVILRGAKIGDDCNICSHVFIENEVFVGDRVTIKAGVQLWDGITLEDDVFIGPNVTFTNDLVPRSKRYPEKYTKSIIRKGASIGANSTILAGIEIGNYSLIGAGSMVTKDVPNYGVFFGNPAKHKGYVTEEGVLVNLDMIAENGEEYFFNGDKLVLK